jgi:hypothetical protein
MKTSIQSLLLSILLIPAISTAQNPAADSKSDTINQFFEKIPIEERMAEAPQQMQNLISQNPFGLPTSQNEKMMKAFEDSFANDSLLIYTRKAFAENYDPKTAEATLRWFQNEETQSILEAEKEFYTIEGIRKRVVNKYEMEQNPPAKERLKLVESLSEEMSAVEMEIESRVIIFRALVSAFSTLNTQQSLTEVQIEGAVNNYRNQLRSQTDQEVTNQLLTVYHGLSDDKIQNQISFYQSEAGKWFNNTISKSLHSAYQTASDKFLSAIQEDS